jgi:hypothetical protein
MTEGLFVVLQVVWYKVPNPAQGFLNLVRELMCLWAQPMVVLCLAKVLIAIEQTLPMC